MTSGNPEETFLQFLDSSLYSESGCSSGTIEFRKGQKNCIQIPVESV